MENIQSFASTNQMEDSEDETMDSYSGYSDTEKYQNYMEIVNTIKFFDNNGHITEDWMEHHKWVIERWRDWVSDYSEVNTDVTEKAFRKACCEIETLISYLIKSIRITKTFDPKVYYILLNKMKYICDNLFEAEELEMLMNNMKVK